MRDSRSGSPLQSGSHDYNLCEAKPQLGIMPRDYYTAFLYTDMVNPCAVPAMLPKSQLVPPGGGV